MKNLHNKLLSRGAASLSDAELLAMLVESSGDARDPQQILLLPVTQQKQMPAVKAAWQYRIGGDRDDQG